MTGFNSKRDAAADKLQEPVEFDAFLESQDFYELMQTYRHCKIDAHIPFEVVQNVLRAVHTETALAQPEQEPVALVIDGVLVKSELPEKYTGHLYTTPPAAGPVQPVQKSVAVDATTMELAESVGLIGPASRTHDLHAAIQRFHDLICANATLKAAKMAADAISEVAPPKRERVLFPTMLRKMWSGGEVQAWLDENVNKEKNNG